MAAPSRWMLVSRPVLGPVLDGGPALLRELIPALPDEPCDYFGDPRAPLRAGHGDGLLRVPRLPGNRGAELLERLGDTPQWSGVAFVGVELFETLHGLDQRRQTLCGVVAEMSQQGERVAALPHQAFVAGL